MHNPVPVITIDGPSGSGKGTVSSLLAHRYGFHLLDSGALYRLVALEVERLGVDLKDEAAIVEVSRSMQVKFVPKGKESVSVLSGGDDLTAQIRAETCGMRASQIALMPGLRSTMLSVQRGFRQPPGLVADGRDMGTVVFPDAQIKIFLTASANERARRRFEQLKQQGTETKMDSLLREITIRDKRDQNRTLAPLRAADDARILDSTSMAIGQVELWIAKIVDCCLSR